MDATPTSPESTRRVLDRDEWTDLRTAGEPLPIVVRASQHSVDVEEQDGATHATVYLREDGVEVRVGHLQFVVRSEHVTVVQMHPPYPIERFTVLYEGDMA